jgi:hypothetical protein
MRRRHDDWINATHILKAAGFDKPARTRILEREVQKETHEKIQGGYGKYQGISISVSGRILAITNELQAPGFLSARVKHLRKGTIYTTDCVRSSSLHREMRARRRLLDTRANQNSRRSQPCRSGVSAPVY